MWSAGAGNEERGFSSFRYGLKFGDVALRVYGKYFDRDGSKASTGAIASDRWQVGRGGFRADTGLGPNDSLTLQGDYYNGMAGQKAGLVSLTPPYQSQGFGSFPISGGNLLGRWNHEFSPTADLRVQLYYDRAERASVGARELRQTADLEAQHSFMPVSWHRLTWGGGYRFTSGQQQNSFTASFDPKRRSDQLFSAFGQSELTLLQDRLRLTLGSKFEHNDYTGFEIQPNVRLAWSPNGDHTFWGAISRAVRTPAQYEHDLRVNVAALRPFTAACPLAMPCLVSVLGRDGFRSENLLAYELGYRARLHPRFTFDASAFYNTYNDLRSGEPGTPFVEAVPGPMHFTIPLYLANKLDAESFGFELSAKWQPSDIWRLDATYSLLRLYLHLDKSSLGSKRLVTDGDSPEHQVRLSSYVELPYGFQFDSALYFTGRLAAIDVPAHTRVDLRLGYRPVKALELSLAVQNLFGPAHREFNGVLGAGAVKIERSLYGKLTWRF